jgi:hypothetical protein
MGILNWLSGADRAGTQRISETVERVMALHPHLRLARRYQARLAPAVAAALAFLGELAQSLPAAREASKAAWGADPLMRAFFVNADDVCSVLSRSADLRAYFARHPDASRAYAVLGMEMHERHVLGVGMEGGALRRDVPQTTLSFTDHQVRICGESEAALREEIIRRLVDQLALEGLARVAAEQSRRNMLERERALLKTREQLLERQGTGMRSLIGGESTQDSGELDRLQADIADNQRALEHLGLKSEALDHALEQVRDVLADPGRHIVVSSRRLALDRMNVVQEAGSDGESNAIALHFARIPGTTPPRTRAFTLIRFDRTDLAPVRPMHEEAARLLASGLLS